MGCQLMPSQKQVPDLNFIQILQYTSAFIWSTNEDSFQRILIKSMFVTRGIKTVVLPIHLLSKWYFLFCISIITVEGREHFIKLFFCWWYRYFWNFIQRVLVVQMIWKLSAEAKSLFKFVESPQMKSKIWYLLFVYNHV